MKYLDGMRHNGIINELYIANRLKKVELELIMMDYVDRQILTTEDVVKNCEILDEIITSDKYTDRWEHEDK